MTRYYLFRDDEVLAVFDEWVPGFPDTVGRWEEDGVLLPSAEVKRALMPGSYHGGSYLDRWCKETGSWWEYTVVGRIRVHLGEGVYVDWCGGYSSWLHCVHVLYTKTRVTKGVRVE